MTRRAWATWGGLALVVVAMIVVLVVRSRPDSAPAARAARLERQLACPVCEGQSVADSNAFEAHAIRAEIPTFIRQGKSDAQIRAYYVSRYGDRILLSPANHGLAVIAWGLPALAFVLGVGGIAVALRRWSRTPRLAASDEDEDLVRDARAADEDDKR